MQPAVVGATEMCGTETLATRNGQIPELFIFPSGFLNIKQKPHGTQLPRSGPHLNGRIPIKKLENGPYTAYPADMFLSSRSSFSHRLVIEVIFINGVEA